MTTEAATAEGAATRDTHIERGYRTSIVDAVVAALERLPGPSWLAYLGLAGLSVGYIALEGLAGNFPWTADSLGRLGYAFFFVYPLAAYHYLSSGARQAWDDFRPATDLGGAAAERMRLELSTTPFRPVAVIFALVAVVNVVSYAAFPTELDLAGRPITHIALRAVSESLWVAPMAIVLIYLVFRQLRLVARLHSSVRRVDLLRPGPMHALSQLTSRSAIALVVFAVYSGIPLPGITEPAWIGTLVAFVAPMLLLALAAFFVPLRGLNRLLLREKGRMLDEVGLRIHAAAEALHRTVDVEAANEDDHERSRASQTRVDALNKALTSLFQERDVIRRLSTWPWDGGTVRAVASAVALPIVLFLITRVLDRFI